MSFISRLPERYGLAEELKQAAWEDESWETVGPLFDEPGGRIYRFLAVHSSALETKKAQTLEKKRSLERETMGEGCRRGSETDLPVLPPTPKKRSGSGVPSTADSIGSKRKPFGRKSPTNETNGVVLAKVNLRRHPFGSGSSNLYQK